MLGPLLTAALENALRMGDAAITGPVSRGDAGTVARHVQRAGRDRPRLAPAYVALARRTADRAIANGRLRPVDAEPLLGVLADPAARRRTAREAATVTAGRAHPRGAGRGARRAARARSPW